MISKIWLTDKQKFGWRLSLSNYYVGIYAVFSGLYLIHGDFWLGNKSWTKN